MPTTESWRSDFRVEIPVTESWRSDFRGEMPAAKLPGQDVGGSPPLQGNKNSCEAYTGENDKSDPDHADQNPWGCFR